MDQQLLKAKINALDIMYDNRNKIDSGSVNELTIYTGDDILQQLKNTYGTKKKDAFGYYYILEVGNNVKVGSTNNLYVRYKTLVNMFEKYGNNKTGRFCVSTIPHTNYEENERLIQDYLSDFRVEDTELFDVLFDSVIKNLNSYGLCYCDEREVQDIKSKTVCSNFQQLLGWA